MSFLVKLFLGIRRTSYFQTHLMAFFTLTRVQNSSFVLGEPELAGAYLEAGGAVESLQRSSEGQRLRKVTSSWTQVLTDSLELLLLLHPRTRLLIAHRGEVPQVPSHDSRPQRRPPRPTSGHLTWNDTGFLLEWTKRPFFSLSQTETLISSCFFS